MSVVKVVVSFFVGIIVLAVALSLAMIPLGKPTLWQLIGAPDVVNAEGLVRESGEPDYIWTVHFNDVSVGLLPCLGFDTPAPRAGDIGTFCSKAQDISLENTATETIVKVKDTSYRYKCVESGASSATISALLVCEVDPLGSIFA